jgi:hypothetical protein
MGWITAITEAVEEGGGTLTVVEEVKATEEEEGVDKEVYVKLLLLKHDLACTYDTIGKTCATLNKKKPTTPTWHHHRGAVTISLTIRLVIARR